MSRLYICPTPIGNLEDITVRTLRILREVHAIACEDTRHSIKLLNHYEIHKPLLAYHQHNIRTQTGVILERIERGEDIAYISDAGMPSISDPGQELIREARKRKIQVEVLPGASASVTALVATGFDSREFLFCGFLPSKERDRKRQLEELKEEKRTMIFYEAPHRFIKTIDQMEKVFLGRTVAICRELTKKHEEVFIGSFEEVKSYFFEGIRGELVILLDAKEEGEIQEEMRIKAESISPIEQMKKYLQEGYSEKDAMKQTAKDCMLKKNEIYKLWLEQKE